MIISVAAFINMITGVNYSILFTSTKYIYGLLFIVLLLFMSIIGNVILIPRYGIMGAAITTAFASIVYNILKYIYILKVFKMQPFDSSFLKILGVILICGVICYFLPQINNHIVAVIVRSFIITTVYVLATYFLKIVPEFHKYIPFIRKGN
jgi:O-antigen/teichoic acid export membrane protein